MIPYQGLLFFYVMGLLLTPAILLGMLEKPIKLYGLLFTAVMLAWVFFENGQPIALVSFYLWQTALCFLFLRVREKTRLKLRLAVLISLLPLLSVKLGEAFPFFHALKMLGISYMTFRGAQVLIDIYDDKIKELRLSEFSYFLLFFPSAASGPIDRYRRFNDDLNRKLNREEYAEMLRRGIWRLMTGAFYCIVASGLIRQIWLEPLPDRGVAATISYMYGYTLYLFFNFAGYSGMAIGTSYILGISLPENFRTPFLSVDMKDFWSRWHISLSTWLRDYIYARFVMDSLRKNRFSNKRTASYIGYIITMTAMGAWHGLTPSYLIYGAYHSLLMCLNEALDLHWKPFREFKRHSFARAVLTIVTFHLFSFGLLIFSGRLL